MPERNTLTISVIRHTEKDDHGQVTRRGIDDAERIFQEQSEGVDDYPCISSRIYFSGKQRTLDTARVFRSAQLSNGSLVKSQFCGVQEALSEGEIEDFVSALRKQVVKIIGKEEADRIFPKVWPVMWLEMDEPSFEGVKTGKQVAAEFSRWVLDQIKMSEFIGGNHEVVAFSHGLVIAAFLYFLDKNGGDKVLNDNWDTMFRTTILSTSAKGYTQINYLSIMNLSYKANGSNEIQICFDRKAMHIPLSDIEEMINHLDGQK